MSSDDLILKAWLHPSMQMPFQFRAEQYPFKVSKSATISDLMEMCEDKVELASKAAGAGVQMQINVLWNVKDHNKAFKMGELVGNHFSSGDTFGVYGEVQPLPPEPQLSPQQAQAMQQMEQMWAVLQRQPPGPQREMMFQQYQQFHAEVMKKFQPERKQPLRFILNDRVVCNMGPRWIGGHVVGTDEDNEQDWDFLVKIDAHPGLASSTICVPEDDDEICMQEVCFTATNMDQIKGAAPEVPLDISKQKLRFKIGDRVACRVRSGDDGLELWCPGKVEILNAPLPGPLDYGDSELSGKFPPTVAYQVALDNGTVVFCHIDNYTLIRKEGLEPQERVKGTSKRMEDRKRPDGSRIRFDHLSEKSRPIDPTSSDSDSDGNEVGQKKAEAYSPTVGGLTIDQKKAMFID